MLRQSLGEGSPRLINAINLGELIYIVQRRCGERNKLEMFAHLHRMDLSILPCPNDLIFRAAELKARHPISNTDAFALASAIEYQAELVTGDREFRRVEYLVGIVWV